MQKVVRMAVPALALLALLGFGLVLTAADEKAKYEIADVMQMAHKDGLLKKVLDGKADEPEKKKLLELYTALPANKPPKGDEAAWKKRTASIVEACKAFIGGDAAAKGKLQMATNCMSCHRMFRQ